MSIGIHIIADLKGVSSEKISSVNEMKKIIENSVKAGHLTKIRSHYHQFSPTGVSGIVLIAESTYKLSYMARIWPGNLRCFYMWTY